MPKPCAIVRDEIASLGTKVFTGPQRNRRALIYARKLVETYQKSVTGKLIDVDPSDKFYTFIKESRARLNKERIREHGYGYFSFNGRKAEVEEGELV